MRTLLLILMLLVGCVVVEIHIDCDTITPPGAPSAAEKSWGD